MSDEPEHFDEADEQDEDLELQDDAADEVKGGMIFKMGDSADFHFDK